MRYRLLHTWPEVSRAWRDDRLLLRHPDGVVRSADYDHFEKMRDVVESLDYYLGAKRYYRREDDVTSESQIREKVQDLLQKYEVANLGELAVLLDDLLTGRLP